MIWYDVIWYHMVQIYTLVARVAYLTETKARMLKKKEGTNAAAGAVIQMYDLQVGGVFLIKR